MLAPQFGLGRLGDSVNLDTLPLVPTDTTPLDMPSPDLYTPLDTLPLDTGLDTTPLYPLLQPVDLNNLPLNPGLDTTPLGLGPDNAMLVTQDGAFVLDQNGSPVYRDAQGNFFDVNGNPTAPVSVATQIPQQIQSAESGTTPGSGILKDISLLTPVVASSIALVKTATGGTGSPVPVASGTASGGTATAAPQAQTQSFTDWVKSLFSGSGTSGTGSGSSISSALTTSETWVKNNWAWLAIGAGGLVVLRGLSGGGRRRRRR